MQSTGHTSTQAVSFVFTHGSQMMYAIVPVSSYYREVSHEECTHACGGCQTAGLTEPPPYNPLLVKPLPCRSIAAPAVLVVGALLSGPGRVSAQDLPLRPVVFGDGRVTIGGDASATFSC